MRKTFKTTSGNSSSSQYILVLEKTKSFFSMTKKQTAFLGVSIRNLKNSRFIITVRETLWS